MRISICIPYHNIPETAFFLERLLKSIDQQTYKDYEIILTNQGKMAENTNAAIRAAKGEIVKIMYMDDYFAHPGALQNLSDAFTGGWLVTGCTNDADWGNHYAEWDDQIHLVNTIGSPSVLAFENKDPIFFDEKLSWMLDADLYRRLYERYGLPTISDTIDTVIGRGPHQMTEKLTPTEKQSEVEYVTNKYAS